MRELERMYDPDEPERDLAPIGGDAPADAGAGETVPGEAALAEMSGLAHAAPPPSPGGRRLVHNFSWAFVGNVVAAGAQWLMIVALAKWIGPESVGQYALAVAIATPVLLFTNVNLRQVLATDAAREYAFGEYFALRLLSTVTTVAVLLLFSVWGGSTGHFDLVLAVVSVERGLAGIADVFYGFLDREEMMDRVVTGLILRAGLGAVAFAAGLLIQGLPAAVIGMILVSLLVLVAYDFPVIVRLARSEPGGLRPRWNWKRLSGLFRMAVPLGVTAVVTSLGLLVPRYFLRHQLGDRELGIFAALLYPMNVGGMVVAALGYAVMPRMARHFAAGEMSAFRTRLLQLAMLGGAFAAAVLVVSAAMGEQILTILYTQEYASRRDLFVWLAAAAGVGYVATAWDSAMTAARALAAQLPLMLLTLTATAVGCMVAIPHYGAVGGAVGMLLGAVTRVAGGAWILHRTLSARASLVRASTGKL